MINRPGVGQFLSVGLGQFPNGASKEGAEDRARPGMVFGERRLDPLPKVLVDVVRVGLPDASRGLREALCPFDRGVRRCVGSPARATGRSAPQKGVLNLAPRLIIKHTECIANKGAKLLRAHCAQGGHNVCGIRGRRR